MIRTAHRLAVVSLALASAAAAAGETAPGKVVFDQYCSHCHAQGDEHPGTQQLSRRADDQDAVLERRTGLRPDLVRMVVRNGLAAMTPFRPTEIDDIEMQALVEYLSAPGAIDPQHSRDAPRSE
jgi:(+)-pinoresinol hydroxylase